MLECDRQGKRKREKERKEKEREITSGTSTDVRELTGPVVDSRSLLLKMCNEIVHQCELVVHTLCISQLFYTTIR